MCDHCFRILGRVTLGVKCSKSFSYAHPTITFMKNFYRWFILHDMNTTQHMYQNYAYSWHYGDIKYYRLELLEVSFPMYILMCWITDATVRGNFSPNRSYEAVLVCTNSTVACIRHLQMRTSSLFLPAGSEVTELMFGTLWMPLGTNDTLDATVYKISWDRNHSSQCSV